MTRLKYLALQFHSTRSSPSQASLPLPPPMRTVLPALTGVWFKGECGYLEDLVARIDAPLLSVLSMTLFSRRTFSTPHLFNFINCTSQLRSPRRADVVFYYGPIVVKLYPEIKTTLSILELQVLRRESDWQLSSLAQFCSSALSSLSTLDYLNIRCGTRSECHPLDNMGKIQWMELLHPFVAVKKLHVAKPLGLRVLSALTELDGHTETEVLPVLQDLFVEELQPLQEAVQQFIAVKQLSGHTVTAHKWDR
jgi:hypothetical protein